MRFLAALLGVSVVALGAVGTGAGAQAQHVNRHIHEFHFSLGLTERCGVEVYVETIADVKATLVYNQSGVVVREIQTSGNGRTTFSAPETGKSFSFTLQRVHLEYGSGAVIGSSVIVSRTGVFNQRPGFMPSEAGLLRYEGVVTGFDESGAPLIRAVDILAERGNRVDNEQLLTATCAALTGP